MTDKQGPKQNEQKDKQWLTTHYTEKGPRWLNELGRCRARVAQ
jgi:hypothetical protein